MFSKYISVGVINTLITLLVIFFCHNILSINYAISYAIGFFAGFINSFILNNLYTFKKKKNTFNIKYFLNFSIFFIIAFSISEIVLIYIVELLNYNKNVGIIISMLTYTIVSYLLFKKFVFTQEISQND
ncbi:MAG TPA: GtrA family protein [Arcobacter sp.]|nr:GtrA family protein [Arcobacter sp.]